MSDPFAPSMTLLETQAIFTLLGIRFWDPVQEQVITHDLEVIAWPADRPERQVTAFRTASGIYTFRGLPGLRHLEYPSGDATPWDDDVIPTRFIFQVNDLRRRYLSLAYSVDVPFRGVFPSDRLVSPGNSPALGIWLFSAATRAANSTLALIRAEIRIADLASPSQPGAIEPAAYAVVAVDVEDDTWYGIAGPDGQVATFFPYPDFASPMGFTSPVRAMPQQSWPLTIRVFYEPGMQQFPAGASVPDIRSLFDQGQASIWENEVGDLLNEWQLDFNFSEELVLHTGEAYTLWLTPA